MAHPSMTGFGSAQADCPAGRLSLEIKSVNSRFFEFNPRMPDDFRWAELLCKEKIQALTLRGKVELRLSLSRSETSLAKTQIHPAGLASALRLAHEIRQDHPEIAHFSVNDLLKLPGVTVESQLNQDQWTALLTQLLNEALEHFQKSRMAEGVRLMDVITERLNLLFGLADQAQRLVPAAIAQQQQRLSEKLREALLAATSQSADSVGTQQGLRDDQLALLNERIRQETAVFGLRIDIAEEIDRLRAHLASAAQAMKEPKASLGKRLDFLTQEMNREANTLGSKSASVELSNISIEMKLLIEQIREQAQNLE